MKTNTVEFTLRVVAVPGGYASRCYLQGEAVGQRQTFPTLGEAIEDTVLAEQQIVADLAAKGIVAVKRPVAQA
jgi:hypothetical protein